MSGKKDHHGIIYSWRSIYLISTLILRFYFAVQTSYIHPDEHYQSFQPLFHDNFPWEFQNPNNINRSIIPLWIFYQPIINLAHWLNLSSLGTYFLVRLNLAFWNWIVVDWCLYRLMPFKHERMKALFFTATSWITLAIQNHSLSNSIETIILLPTVYLIDQIRQYLESRPSNTHNVSKFKLLVLGVLIAVGVFNRITFVAWIILPSWFLLRYLIRHPIRFAICIVSFILACLIIIALDTSYFHQLDLWIVIRMINNDLHLKFLQLKSLPIKDWSIYLENITTTYHSSYVIAPLNNLLYNLNESNLQIHGIHPRYLHILVYYPLMTGPLLLLLPPFKWKYWKTTPALTIFSGLLLLSLVKHQEARFLIPMWPLVASIIVLDDNEEPINIHPQNQKNQKSSSKWISTNFIIKLWLIYSLLLSIFYNLFHQAGIVPAMNELNKLIPPNKDELGPFFIFWRTYQPPTWMLNVQHLEYTHDGVDKSLFTPIYSNINSILSLSQNEGEIIIADLMGSPFSILNSTLKNDISSPIYLITPQNALPWLNKYNIEYTPIWETSWHLDMDHFEYDLFHTHTFKLGLGIYKLL